MSGEYVPNAEWDSSRVYTFQQTARYRGILYEFRSFDYNSTAGVPPNEEEGNFNSTPYVGTATGSRNERTWSIVTEAKDLPQAVAARVRGIKGTLSGYFEHPEGIVSIGIDQLQQYLVPDPSIPEGEPTEYLIEIDSISTKDVRSNLFYLNTGTSYELSQANTNEHGSIAAFSDLVYPGIYYPEPGSFGGPPGLPAISYNQSHFPQVSEITPTSAQLEELVEAGEVEVDEDGEPVGEYVYVGSEWNIGFNETIMRGTTDTAAFARWFGTTMHYTVDMVFYDTEGRIISITSGRAGSIAAPELVDNWTSVTTKGSIHAFLRPPDDPEEGIYNGAAVPYSYILRAEPTWSAP